jgi:hypothetical protein
MRYYWQTQIDAPETSWTGTRYAYQWARYTLAAMAVLLAGCGQVDSEVMLAIISAVATICVAAISAYGSLALAAVRRRAGLQADQTADERILEQAVLAVHWAEESARRQVKAPASVPPPGAEKLALAEARLRRALVAAQLPVPEDLEGLLEAVLHVERPAMGGES